MTSKCFSKMMVGIGSSLHDLGAADLTNFIVSSNVSGLNSCNLLLVSNFSSMKSLLIRCDVVGASPSIILSIFVMKNSLNWSTIFFLLSLGGSDKGSFL